MINEQAKNTPRAALMTETEKDIIEKATKICINGWIHLRVKGSPYERGYQQGYYLVGEYLDAMRVYKYMTLQTLGMDYSYFVDNAVRLHKAKILPYQLEELKGMSAGLTAAGAPVSVDDLIGWNDWMELTGYWWPKEVVRYMGKPTRTHKSSHCSAIVATGSATIDGKPVIGHESFDEFWSGQYFNICLDVTPDTGHRFVMQTVPCALSSTTDFYVTDANLAITETTMAGFEMYDETGVPEFVRIRDAVQFSNSIDEFVQRLNKGNNGGYANAWLIADNNTGEIARYEQGLRFQSLERTKDGVFFGCNAVFDPRIRNLECRDNDFNDPRQQTGARRIRFMQLIEKYSGKFNLDIVKKVLADTYDPYLGYTNPSSRGICSHYDVDPQYYADNPNAVWNVPFYPAGSCDAKAASSDDIKNLRMRGRYGRADGVEFDAEDFFDRHPQWRWQKGYLQSRPSQPWTLFNPIGDDETDDSNS